MGVKNLLLFAIWLVGLPQAQIAASQEVNWTRTTSSILYSDTNEWVQIKYAILHHGKVYVRTPHNIDLATMTWARRRLLSDHAYPADHVQLRFINNSVPCICDRVEARPSFLIHIVFWGHYGHTMYDGVTAVWSVISKTLTAIPDLLLYINFAGPKAIASTDAAGNIDLGEFQEVFGAFTRYKTRSIQALLRESYNATICFKNLIIGPDRRLGHGVHRAGDFNVTRLRELADLLLQHLPGSDQLDSKCQFRVTVLDRQTSRQILNVQDLKAKIELALTTEGIERSCVSLAALEQMAIGEQLHLMRATRVLVGVDGTGLLNSAFMPKCGGCVHIKPYFQDLLDRGKEAEFETFCTKISGHWRSWTNTNFTSNVFSNRTNPEWIQMAYEARTNATVLIRLKEQISAANSHGFYLSRGPKMYVDATAVASLVQDIVHATKADCTDLELE